MATNDVTEIGRKVRIRQSGNSIVVTIPSGILEESELEAGKTGFVSTDGSSVSVDLWE